MIVPAGTAPEVAVARLACVTEVGAGAGVLAVLVVVAGGGEAVGMCEVVDEGGGTARGGGAGVGDGGGMLDAVRGSGARMSEPGGANAREMRCRR